MIKEKKSLQSLENQVIALNQAEDELMQAQAFKLPPVSPTKTNAMMMKKLITPRLNSKSEIEEPVKLESASNIGDSTPKSGLFEASMKDETKKSDTDLGEKSKTP